MFKQILVAGILSIICGVSVAMPIDGSFGINDGTSMAKVNTITDAVTFNPAPADFTITDTMGDFNAYNGDASGKFFDFDYTIAGVTGDISIPGLFTFSTFTFNVTSIFQVYESSQSTNANVDLWGYGILVDSSLNGYDDTVMMWNFNNSIGRWSGYAVPAPATLALFGLGLIGIALTQRRNKREG